MHTGAAVHMNWNQRKGNLCMCVCIRKQELQAESAKGFSLRLANEYVHFHLHCFFDNNDVPLGETKGAIDSRMCWASLQEVGREAPLIALLGASRLHLIGQLEEPAIGEGRLLAILSRRNK